MHAASPTHLILPDLVTLIIFVTCTSYEAPHYNAFSSLPLLIYSFYLFLTVVVYGDISNIKIKSHYTNNNIRYVQMVAENVL
jgi:hypothetical protein